MNTQEYSIAYYAAVLVMTLLVAVVMYGLTVWMWDSPAELRAYDMLLHLRPAPHADSRIVIVNIDEKSTAELGPLPWSRVAHARILNALRQAGAHLVIYDLLMNDPDSAHPGADEAFRRTMLSTRTVILPMTYDPLRDSIWTPSDIRKLVYLERHALTQRITYPVDALIYRYYYFVPPYADFVTAAEGVGVDVSPDGESDVVRHAQLAYLTRVEYPVPSTALPRTMVMPKLMDQTAVFEGLPLTAARQWLGISRALVQVNIGQDIRFLTDYETRTSIPIDEYGRMMINYSGSAGTYTQYSAVDLLQGRLDRNTFAGKIVLVGVTDPESSVPIRTPYGLISKAEVTANSIATILNRSFIIRRPIEALAALLITGVLLGILLPFVPWRVLGPTCVALPIVYLMVSFIVMGISGHLLPVIPGVVLCIAAVVLAGFLRLGSLTGELVAALDEQI
ncbi:MAG: CHASE2 domain-containing protein [Armatimonadota bacterium]